MYLKLNIWEIHVVILGVFCNFSSLENDKKKMWDRKDRMDDINRNGK